MGQTLSDPITEKDTSHGGDDRLVYGASGMQGWRLTMEDAHTTLLKLGNSTVAFFGVYDGHGGKSTARYCGQYLHDRVLSDPAFVAGEYEKAIKQGFLGVDEDLRKVRETMQDNSGCTAIVALITSDNQLYVGNAGDSRAVLSSAGKAIPMSFDHKPANEVESNRIYGAGGFVEFGRVNGNLALSRAIGDFDFKRNAKLKAEDQIVTSYPDVTVRTMTPDDEFIVIACDGIWDVMTNDEVVEFVRRRLAQGLSLQDICEKMMNTCLAEDAVLGGLGCDNMTIIIVGFLQGATEEKWRERFKGADEGPDPVEAKLAANAAKADGEEFPAGLKISNS